MRRITLSPSVLEFVSGRGGDLTVKEQVYLVG